MLRDLQDFVPLLRIKLHLQENPKIMGGEYAAPSLKFLQGELSFIISSLKDCQVSFLYVLSLGLEAHFPSYPVHGCCLKEKRGDSAPCSAAHLT